MLSAENKVTDLLKKERESVSQADQKMLILLKKEVAQVLNVSIAAKKKSRFQLRILNDSFVKEKAQLVNFLAEKILEKLQYGQVIDVKILKNHQDKILASVKDVVSKNSKTIESFLNKKEFEHHPERVLAALKSNKIAEINDVVNAVSREMKAEIVADDLRVTITAVLSNNVKAASGRIYGSYTRERDAVVSYLAKKSVEALSKADLSADFILKTKKQLVESCKDLCVNNQDLEKFLKTKYVKDLKENEPFVAKIAETFSAKASDVYVQSIKNEFASELNIDLKNKDFSNVLADHCMKALEARKFEHKFFYENKTALINECRKICLHQEGLADFVQQYNVVNEIEKHKVISKIVNSFEDRARLVFAMSEIDQLNVKIQTSASGVSVPLTQSKQPSRSV